MRSVLALLFCVVFLKACVNINDHAIDSAIASYFDNEIPSFELAYFDLNEDGVGDAIIYINDTKWCGSGGCTTLIFVGFDGGFTFKSKSLIVKKPILISKNKSNGWFDIVVNTSGENEVLLKYNGESYPINPSLQDSAKRNEIEEAELILE